MMLCFSIFLSISVNKVTFDSPTCVMCSAWVWFHEPYLTLLTVTTWCHCCDTIVAMLRRVSGLQNVATAISCGFWWPFDLKTSCENGRGCMCRCSGIIMSHSSASATAAISELTAYSGSAYLYFYSDAAVNMSGFSIRYRFVMLFWWSPSLSNRVYSTCYHWCSVAKTADKFGTRFLRELSLFFKVPSAPL